jgi:hypothetical protein
LLEKKKFPLPGGERIKVRGKERIAQADFWRKLEDA